MEVILKEDIIGLGYKNDIVNVKNGYGRNLTNWLPRRLLLKRRLQNWKVWL